jgi:hypothetical protein
MRAVIYARYSSDQQREASIEDQVRLCRERIDREGWSFLATYSDAAMSGAARSPDRSPTCKRRWPTRQPAPRPSISCAAWSSG